MYDRALGNKRDNPHNPHTFRADQWIPFPDFLNTLAPGERRHFSSLGRNPRVIHPSWHKRGKSTLKNQRFDRHWKDLSLNQRFTDVDPVSFIENQFIQRQQIRFQAGLSAHDISHTAGDIPFKN